MDLGQTHFLPIEQLLLSTWISLEAAGLAASAEECICSFHEELLDRRPDMTVIGSVISVP